MNQSNVRVLLSICILFFLLAINVLAQGVHVHNPEADKLSRQTQTTFNQISSSDSDVFATMLANTTSLRDQTIQQLYDLNEQSLRALANKLPLMKWSGLASDVASLQDEFLQAYQRTTLIMGVVPGEIRDLQAAVNQSAQRAADLTNQLATAKAAFAAESPKLADMKSSLTKLKEDLQHLPKVRKLSDLKNYAEFAKVWDDIAAAKDWVTKAEKAKGGPGEQLVILDLAVQLQANAVKRLGLQEQDAAARLSNAQLLNQHLQQAVGNGKTDASGHLAGGDFGKIYEYIKPCPPGTQCPSYGFPHEPDEQVLTTIGKLAQQANKEVGTLFESTLALRNLMDVLARYSSLVGYQRFLLLQSGIDEVNEAQLFAIRMSAVNSDSRAVLIRHGLEGIATYEAGGITPDDVANVFRAAQTIASAVIAGRI